MTHQKLADLLGVTRPAITHRFGGGTQWGYDELLELAAALKVQVRDLV